MQQTISLIVLTYKRDDILLSNLSKILTVFNEFHEIIIVDNGRSASLVTRLKDLYASVKIIQPDENLGAVGRSLGIRASTGDIVLTLDDDLTIKNPESLKSLPLIFSVLPAAGCINFKILYEDGATLDASDWCHPYDHTLFQNHCFETNYISEGACAFNGDLVRKIGGYSDDLFIGQEGVELAARIVNASHVIYYHPNIITLHSTSQIGRESGRQFYYNSRNILIIAVRNYPLLYAIKTVGREWLTLFIFSVLRFRFLFFVKGCISGLMQMKAAYKQRICISKKTVAILVTLNKTKASVSSRFLRLLGSKTLD
jgi:GT2 family glycosyltransferase